MIEGIRIELSMFSMEWKEGFEEINFVSRKAVRDGVKPLIGLVKPADEGMGVILNAYDPIIKLRFKKISEKEGKNIKEKIIQILTLCFDYEKGETVGILLFNTGDFVYNPETKEVSLVSCREIGKMPIVYGHGYTKDESNICRFIHWLLSEKEMTQGVDYIPTQLWRNYEDYIFEPEDVFNGIGRALMEQYGPDVGMEKLKEWIGLYASELNPLSYHVEKGEKVFIAGARRYLDYFASTGITGSLPWKFSAFSFLPQINIPSKILPS
ncbi:unnamed protein product, partial [marine sediment metagenome]